MKILSGALIFDVAGDDGIKISSDIDTNNCYNETSTMYSCSAAFKCKTSIAGR